MLLFEISRVEFFFKAASVIDGPSRSCFVLLRLYEALACAVLCALRDAPPFGFMTHPTTILNTCQHGKSYPTSRGLGGRRRKKGKRKKKKSCPGHGFEVPGLRGDLCEFWKWRQACKAACTFTVSHPSDESVWDHPSLRKQPFFQQPTESFSASPFICVLQCLC